MAFDANNPKSPLIKYLVGLQEVYDLLMKASYHYADDSAREWGAGSKLVKEAADVAVENNWTFNQCLYAFNEIAPLVGFDMFMKWVLDGAYRKPWNTK